jgi:glycosyltransferase involved in cell wall biosynthesis
VTKPIPILFAHNGLDWVTGSERCLLDLVAHLDRERFRPVVMCNGASLAAAAEKLGATVYWQERYGDARPGFLPDPSLVREARRVIRDESIRLVHANAFQTIKWLLPAARGARIPVVLHVHIPTSQEERCYTWSHQVTHVVGVGRAALSGFLEDGLPRERTSIIYNAVDPERLLEGDTTALRAALGVRPGDLVLTAVGSLIARKGLDVLIDALARTRTAAPGIQVRMLVVGEGPERERLQMVARSLGVSEIVHFLGTRTDVGAILRGATDIALSAARAEALPLNVLEAGFFGLPLIVSDIPPHREIVEPGRTGLVVPVNDPAGFAEAILDLLQNTERRQAIGRLARQHVHSSFLIERYVREFSSLYTRLVESPARTCGWVRGGVWPRAYTEWLRRSAQARVSAILTRWPVGA